VFAEGNSFLAQLFYAMLCESRAEIYKMEGNSLIAFSPSGVSLFLLDNDPYWNDDTERTVSLLKDIAFDPTIIVLGSLNSIGKCKPGGGHTCLSEDLKNRQRPGPDQNKRRSDTFSTAFRTSRLVKHFGRHLPNNCQADFKNCKRGGGHTCIPGPINTNAEELVRVILNKL
jgi:hypothetical protein